ncbi:uncharacterized protein LOC126834606 [Adelges cooleyi]|uniref:uncharacterized protein LOC126834606 n=1 Tax=Adelges cooleyi TaxID=133065 RepID=UPI0021808D57|nr:uncharacterized protein LOC126834606 [Adelges cooleyi]
MASKKIIPLFNNVLVKKFFQSQQTKSGLFRGTKAPKPTSVGVVLAIGKKCKQEPGNHFKVGDKVYLTDLYNGKKVNIEDVEYALFMYKDIDLLGVIEDHVSNKETPANSQGLTEKDYDNVEGIEALRTVN